MSKLITAVSSKLEFARYVNRIIYDFESKESHILNRDFEPKSFNLIFLIRNLSCNYSMEFKNECFFLKLNYELDDEKYPELRDVFYEKMNFLFSEERFYGQDQKSICLKSKIDHKYIERAQIIFATERWMRTYFFPETKIAIEEIVLMVFDEFKETMHQIWKTIFESFDTVDFTKLTQLTEDISSDDLIIAEEENLYNLPPIIKIYFDSYQRQKSEKMTEPKSIMGKKNLVQRIYILMKKL